MVTCSGKREKCIKEKRFRSRISVGFFIFLLRVSLCAGELRFSLISDWEIFPQAPRSPRHLFHCSWGLTSVFCKKVALSWPLVGPGPRQKLPRDLSCVLHTWQGPRGLILSSLTFSGPFQPHQVLFSPTSLCFVDCAHSMSFRMSLLWGLRRTGSDIASG